MKHYAGLDISVKETSVCFIDEAGTICRELKVASPPEDLTLLLKGPRLVARADRSRSWFFVAMAVQWSGEGWSTCRLQ
jgi:transposase